MGIVLRKICEGDLENIMRWRMDPEITRYMNTNPKLTMEGQKKWLSVIEKDPDVLYWVIVVDGEPAGVINLKGLTKADGEIGWAYYVGEKRLRSMKLAISLEMSMYEYVFDTLKKTAVYSDVFSLNTGVIALHKICGCEVVEEKKQCVCKENVWYDVTFMRMTNQIWNSVRETKKYEKISFGE